MQRCCIEKHGRTTKKQYQKNIMFNIIKLVTYMIILYYRVLRNRLGRLGDFWKNTILAYA